jgi:hypothetical protein
MGVPLICGALLADECERSPTVSVSGLGLLVSGNESQYKFQGTRAAITHPMLKGPITLVNVMRRETNYRCPSNDEYPPREAGKL